LRVDGFTRASLSKRGQSCWPRPRGLDVDFLGDLDGVVNLDAKVADGAFDLRVAEQDLDDADVGAALQQMGCEGMAKRMKRQRFAQPRRFRRLLEQPADLTRGQRPMLIATGKQPALFRRNAGALLGSTSCLGASRTPGPHTRG
jgi:hypothetical protein